eukprot:m.231889 g.231889  ORF g.231889 m.231889 type:complete len:565 (+) comp12274_c0_seq1:375-2069(+)
MGTTLGEQVCMLPAAGGLVALLHWRRRADGRGVDGGRGHKVADGGNGRGCRACEEAGDGRAAGDKQVVALVAVCGPPRALVQNGCDVGTSRQIACHGLERLNDVRLDRGSILDALQPLVQQVQQVLRQPALERLGDEAGVAGLEDAAEHLARRGHRGLGGALERLVDVSNAGLAGQACDARGAAGQLVHDAQARGLDDRAVAVHGHDQLVDQAERRHLVGHLGLGGQERDEGIRHGVERLDVLRIQRRLGRQLRVLLQDGDEEILWMAERPVGLLDQQPQEDAANDDLAGQVLVHDGEIVGQPPRDAGILGLLLEQRGALLGDDAGNFAARLVVPDELGIFMTALEHGHGGLGVVPHGIHEDQRQELGQHDAHARPVELVRQHLAEESGGRLAHLGVGRVGKQIQQVDQRALVDGLVDDLPVGCHSMQALQRGRPPGREGLEREEDVDEDRGLGDIRDAGLVAADGRDDLERHLLQRRELSQAQQGKQKLERALAGNLDTLIGADDVAQGLHRLDDALGPPRALCLVNLAALCLDVGGRQEVLCLVDDEGQQLHRELRRLRDGV